MIFICSFLFPEISLLISLLIQIQPSVAFWDHSSLERFYPPLPFDCPFHLAINHELPLTLLVLHHWTVFPIQAYLSVWKLVLTLPWPKGKWNFRKQAKHQEGWEVSPLHLQPLLPLPTRWLPLATLRGIRSFLWKPRQGLTSATNTELLRVLEIIPWILRRWDKQQRDNCPLTTKSEWKILTLFQCNSFTWLTQTIRITLWVAVHCPENSAVNNFTTYYYLDPYHPKFSVIDSTRVVLCLT